MSRPGVIEAEKHRRCDLCDKVAELRPYGPNGENVCFECGMKDEEAAKRQFTEQVLQEPYLPSAKTGSAVNARAIGDEEPGDMR